MEEQQNWSGIFQVSWMPGGEGAEGWRRGRELREGQSVGRLLQCL